MDQFDALFRRADLDHDGRISGAEAVAFFQGSNLPKSVLAQIWQHADQNRTGFLGRQEFYNALKLVTVAQSKRDLTPDIVKAALYGPASAKIPPPQINLSALPPSQPNPMAPRPPTQQPGIANSIPSSQPSSMAPSPHIQQPGIVNSIPSSQPNSMAQRPPTQQPGIVNSIPPQTFGIRGQVPPNSMSVASLAPPSSVQFLASQNQSMRPTPSGPLSLPLQGVGGPSLPPGGGLVGPGVPNPQAPLPASSFTTPRPSLGSGNISDNMFGGDMFSASQSLSKPSPSPSPSPIPTQTASSEPQGPVKIDPLGALTAFTRQPTGAQVQPVMPAGPRPSQPGPTQNSSFGSSGFSAEVKTQAPNVSQTPNVSQPQWPKMTRAGVNKYMKVFMEVDSDRDGKITGEQARNLFMSWKLPREILKQVWDLSDQDNDSMLSMREFCIALYLMERYREGHNLPPTLPSNVLLDETLLSLTGPPNPSFRPPNWGPNPGHAPQQVVAGGQGQPMPHAGMRPPMSVTGPQPLLYNNNQQKGHLPSMDTSHSPHLTNGDQNNSHSISHDTNGPEKVVEDKKVILDSREKMTFFRNKMQDLVLYKSRCDNRLNEITERALADKREAELLAKKYEEKYKLVAEVASKLTIEEASFRDIQERKMELNQALVKMEQGGSADGILQVRADRIQSDLEELLKALSERCKKHGISVKSTAIIELPQGWQPGVPEISAVWDEDWDKFEDEGFSFDVVAPTNPKSTSQPENPSPIDNDSYSNADVESEKPFETESAYDDESAKSPAGSSTTQKIFESPTKEDSFSRFGKSFDADTETNSGFDDQGWGTFDNNDDVDSVWGFNSEATKEADHEKHGENYFFDSSSFTASPRRTDSPQGNTFFQKKSPFGFDDSVPGSPASRAGTSPRYSVGGAENSFFDNFSRYDSFSATDRGSPKRETFSRFDSMSSTTQDNNFSRFDSMSSTTQDRNFARFDSMSSSAGYDHGQAYSFDDADPFGSSGPFKVSTEGQTGKHESHKWAF